MGFVFGSQNNEKSCKNGVEKNVFFSKSDLKLFFSYFCDIGSILGGPGGSKNGPGIEKIVFGTLLGRVRDFGPVLGAILERFWEILGGFGEDLGGILGRFFGDF